MDKINKLEELVVNSSIMTMLVVSSWGLTNSVLSTYDPDEQYILNMFGFKIYTTRYLYFVGLSTITTALCMLKFKND